MSTPPEPTSALPPTRIISFLQKVVEADPTYYKQLIQPTIYEFSNGRKYIAPVPLYTST